MKRWLGLAVVGAVLVAMLVWGWQHLKAGLAPKIVLADTTCNFGTMDQEKLGDHTYEIGNEGRGELTLQIANTTCGCTRVQLNDLVWNPKDGVAPPSESVRLHTGEKARLKVVWDTERRSGPFRTSAKLNTNDPEHPLAEFFIEGEIMPFIELSLRQVQVQVRNDQAYTKTFEIYSRKLDSMEISADSSDPLIQATFAPASEEYLESVSAKCGYQGTVQIEPGLPIGPFDAKLTLHTNCPERPVVTVSIVGDVQGEVILTPDDKLNFKIVRTGEGRTLGLTVKLRSESPVTVQVAHVVPEFLKVTLQQSETGRNFYQLKVEVPVGAPGGAFNGEIELETDHPTAKLIKIPVRGGVVR